MKRKPCLLYKCLANYICTVCPGTNPLHSLLPLRFHSPPNPLFHCGPNNNIMFLTAVEKILINVLVITNNVVLHCLCNKGNIIAEGCINLQHLDFY